MLQPYAVLLTKTVAGHQIVSEGSRDRESKGQIMHDSEEFGDGWQGTRLHVCTMYDLQAGELDLDIKSKWYGVPKFYIVRQGSTDKSPR